MNYKNLIVRKFVGTFAGLFAIIVALFMTFAMLEAASVKMIEVKISEDEINEHFDRKIDFSKLSNVESDYSTRYDRISLAGLYDGQSFILRHYNSGKFSAFDTCEFYGVSTSSEAITVQVSERIASSGNLSKDDLIECLVGLFVHMDDGIEEMRNKAIQAEKEALKKELNKKSLGM